jgi:hypothetical protein
VHCARLSKLLQTKETVRTLTAAVATKRILKDSSYYATISSRTIMRWADTENVVSAKPGRKISEDFENEVSGNLMLCIFEKNEIEV